MTELKIGTRKLQKVRGAYILNMPIYAVRTLNLHPGDEMGVTIDDDNTLRIRKEEYGALPDPHLGGSSRAATCTTPKSVNARV